MSHVRSALFFLLSLSFIINRAEAQVGIETDPAVLDALRGENFEPGGQFFPSGLSVRGSVIDSTRTSDVQLYTNPMVLVAPNLAIQQGTVEGTVGYTVDLSSHHPSSVHAPFSNSSSTSETIHADNDARSLSFNIQVDATLDHPANGYDGPQGDGYPSPSHHGAIDNYTLKISGQIEGTFRVRSDDPRSDRSPSGSGRPPFDGSPGGNPFVTSSGRPDSVVFLPEQERPHGSAYGPTTSSEYYGPFLTGNPTHDGLTPGSNDQKFVNVPPSTNNPQDLSFAPVEPPFTGLTWTEQSELVEIGVDIAGIADPTPFSDGARFCPLIGI